VSHIECGSKQQARPVKFFNHAKVFIHEDITIARVTPRAEQDRRPPTTFSKSLDVLP
jgi:hypothetical protein